MAKPNPMGSTFAERAAAAAGEGDFTAPDVDRAEPQSNATFGDRAKAAGRRSSKAVDSEGAEDKSVASASSKSRKTPSK